MSDHVLKGTLLGGFKRSDVMEYIERSAKEYSEAVAALRTELDAACKERDGLAVERDFLLEKSAGMDALREEKAALAREADALRAAKADAEGEIETLRAELERLRPEWEEYQSIKTRLSEIQIEACRRASELEENTRSQMQELEDATYARLQGLTDGCRTLYNDAFVTRFPEVFDELDRLLTRETQERSEDTAQPTDDADCEEE